MRYVEFMKKVVPMHDDLFDFFYEALPGYEKVGLRRTLLGCWGSFQDPEYCNFAYKDMTDVGSQDVRHPRRRGRRQAGHHTTSVDINLGIRILLGSSYYDDWDGPGDVRQARPAGQPGRPPAPVEPAHEPEAAEARPRRQVQLGHVARAGSTARTTWRWTPAADRSPGCGRRRWPAWSTWRLRHVHRPQRADQPARRRRSRAR